MADYFVLSNFGVRYFLLPYTDSDSVPATASAEAEITSVLSCSIGQFSKETARYRTLNGNGWESIAPLGNAAEDGTFSCIREGTGDVYNGGAGSGTYTRMKAWFMQATQGAGVASPRCLVEILPRGGEGDQAYEGTCYYVVPSEWTPGEKDTETGQEYSFSVSPFGPQAPLKVTYTPASGDTAESWSFEKAQVA